MNNTFPQGQISQTGNLDSNLKLRQYKLDPMAKFMGIRAMIPKLPQKRLATELGYSSTILKRYRNDINKLSLFRVQPNTNKRRQKISNDNSNSQHEPERSQTIPNEPKRAQNEHVKSLKKQKYSERRIHA